MNDGASFGRIRSAALALWMIFLFAPGLLAQGGYTTEKRPDLGLTFPRARDYEEIPIPPSEDFTVLYFGEKVPEKAEQKRRVRPEMSVLWIDHLPDRELKTGADTPPPPTGGDTGAPEGGEDKAAPKKKVINSVERYFEVGYRDWKLGKPTDGKDRNGIKPREFILTAKKGAPHKGWIYSYDTAKRSIAVFGLCAAEDFDEQVKIWRNTAEHLDIKEPEEKSPDKLKVFYARKPLKAIDYRIQVRLDLVRGWKAEDTENYIVVYDTPDQPLLRRLLRDLELLRKEYEKLFPPVKPVEAISTVRVCKNRDEYMSYGGPPMSAGYWNWVDEELVFYDAETVDKQHRKSDADTFIVLYHEAFHQYIHYSTGELPPHSWFNEGTGDYFSGAVIKDGKLQKIGPNPWRLHTIKDAIAAEQFVPWKDMIKFEQPQYYNPAIVHICYAQGWSMIYFLRKCEAVEKNPAWKKILPTYFDTLKSVYGAKIAELEAAGKKDDKEAKAKAGLEARTGALEEAFKDVDLDELEQAWKTFTWSIEDIRKR
jgi:hypothetical protein